ncbi:MAG: D-sedoheptulose 7-phosphate isomerase [Rhodospirillales bacterium]|nr:D-sedoheptulose 7-phosphate isomerase [Rhodospirillales bacterium]MDE2197487.1 D-sedoheptulose 7-phosphate isomerase [Rhodospirillales bacterium]MDE2574108.1 D-sedoheptulose 7-phosphate isomerase [Rhodospirillales bacterium]
MTDAADQQSAQAAYAGAYLAQSAAAIQAFAADPAARAVMLEMARAITASLRGGGKLLIAGNGGSAADAQHIAGEMVGRLMFDHAPLAAIALTTDSSGLTAIANDYGYDAVFERQLRALARPGDVFLGISTSGNSPSILAPIAAAREMGVAALGFTGAGGGRMAGLCDTLLAAPSGWTPIIQQIHITAAHLICALVERAMFPDRAPPAPLTPG